jgi:hypothetical protein
LTVPERSAPAGRLLLDEMHAPVVAAELRRRGHDVLAVAEEPVLRAWTDEELFRLAAPGQPPPLGGRRIVTENVKDFRPLLRRAEEAMLPTSWVLFTSSRRFARSRRNPGPLIDALDAWLARASSVPPPAEDWLLPALPPAAPECLPPAAPE